MSEKEFNKQEIENQIGEKLGEHTEAVTDAHETVEGQTDEIPDHEKTFADLTPEEKEELIKKFNEDPDNVGYLVANDKTPEEGAEEKLQEQLDSLMQEYQDKKVIIAPLKDKHNMPKYVIEFVKKHMIWEGSWWRTVITLVDKLEEAASISKEENKELQVDFVTVYVLNKIFNEDTIRSNYDGALFMEKNLERLTYFGNRISLAYAYVTQFSKNIQTLQRAIMCLKSGLNVEVTLPELEEIDIKNAEEKSKSMIEQFKKDGII